MPGEGWVKLPNSLILLANYVGVADGLAVGEIITPSGRLPNPVTTLNYH